MIDSPAMPGFRRPARDPQKTAGFHARGRLTRLLPLLVAAMALFSPPAIGDESRLDYPETRRVDHVDTYHGTDVPDPYRWLEADVRESEEVAAWTRAQNRVARSYLDAIPGREAIQQRLTELWNYERTSLPERHGELYFFAKNDGLQNQAAYFVQDDLESEASVLIDPNTWSEDGTVSLGGVSPSDDGTYTAYAVVEAGSDWRTWKVMHTRTREVLDDTIEWTKTWGVSWTRDNRGFFYSRFPKPPQDQAYQSVNLNERIYYHRLGTPQSSDTLVFEQPDHPEWNLDGTVTEDGRYLVITVAKGTDRKYRVYYRDLADPFAGPVALVKDFENEYSFLGNDGSTFYFRTDLDAPRKRVVAVGIDTVGADSRIAPRTVIPEAEETLGSVGFVGNLLVASYLKDAHSVVRVYNTSGERIRDVELPGLGTASGFGGTRHQTETFYSFSSYATPPTIFRYDTIRGESTVFRRSQVEFDPDEYTVNQVFFVSKDGTRVPMFIAHRKDLRMDGNRPTLLYGYGGFSIPITPRFSVTRLQWMEMGGVYAVANLRGGGEYGEAWHRAGTQLNKQNVFDDFIAAAEWLIESGYTRPDRLAIEGRSNGGLLVGAVMTQRPELFGACLPEVGVHDMLRFHHFTAGRYWVDDYGSADDPEQFKALLAYSPYHNVEPGTRFPPTMVLTADTDDRVVPSHSFKFGAALQHAQSGSAPILLRIESRAGHGAGTPTTKRIEEATDIHAFLAKQLGIDMAP